MSEFSFEVCLKCGGLLKDSYCMSCNVVSKGEEFKVNQKLAQKITKKEEFHEEMWNGPAEITGLYCSKCKGSYFKWFTEPKSDDEPPMITYLCCTLDEKGSPCGRIFYTYK